MDTIAIELVVGMTRSPDNSIIPQVASRRQIALCCVKCIATNVLSFISCLHTQLMCVKGEPVPSVLQCLVLCIVNICRQLYI